jgi:hypothetical protein
MLREHRFLRKHGRRHAGAVIRAHDHARTRTAGEKCEHGKSRRQAGMTKRGDKNAA